MHDIIDLNAFRAEKNARQQAGEENGTFGPKPLVSREEIYARDYSRFENVLYALLKAKEILSHHLYYFEDWKHYILCIIDCLSNPARSGPDTDLEELFYNFKGFIGQETTQENFSDMGLVVLILDLVSNSRLVRRSIDIRREYLDTCPVTDVRSLLLRK